MIFNEEIMIFNLVILELEGVEREMGFHENLAIDELLGIGVFVEASWYIGGYEKNTRKILYCVIRLVESKLGFNVQFWRGL